MQSSLCLWVSEQDLNPRKQSAFPSAFVPSQDISRGSDPGFLKIRQAERNGFLESVYHSALIIALREDGLDVDSKPPFKVEFRGQIVGDFEPDIVVNKTVLV